MLKTAQKISEFLSSKTSVFIIIVAIITYFFPNIFMWVKGNTQTVILGIIMLTMGMTLSLKDFQILMQRPLDIGIGTFAQYFFMPVIAICLVHILHLPKEIAIGLILVGCCPGGVSSNIMSFLCKGDVAFSVGMTAVSTLLAPIMTPALVYYLAKESVNVDVIGMFQSVLIVTILPVITGVILNYFFRNNEKFPEICKVMPALSVLGLACIVGGVVAHFGSTFIKSGIVIFIAAFCHNFIGYVAGWTIGRIANMPEPKKRTISIEVGMQNAGLATVLATKHFALIPEAAIISAVSCVWHSISGTILANLFLIKDKIKK
ncbi:MAG: bile acid:sodium symporter family protein [Candidatus Gastranaerophilales bacterium]|nr:bile acid:sodium symporter family protein [Candidatus Gastranaerophilales bacterium]